jgi:hypothetical protein
MATVYKTTVFYPNERPHQGDAPLTELWARISAISGTYISGPEIQDLGPGTGGFTTSRRWASMLSAQTFIDNINELMVGYDKTTTITEEVT